MTIRLLVAALLIAISFGALYVIVGPERLSSGSGDGNQPLINSIEGEQEPGGISIGSEKPDRVAPTISGSGRIRLPGEPVLIHQADGSIRTEYRIILEGESKTEGNDRLTLTDGFVRYFDVDEKGDKTLRGEVVFGTALVRIGENAEGQVALLETTRDLELRRATVQSFGDNPIILRDISRLLIKEDTGFVTFEAPPIEGIPQPVLIEFPQAEGPSSFLEGYGISGAFPAEQGEGDIRVRIDSDPLVRYGDIRLLGRGHAQYDERAKDGAGLLVLDGGVEVYSEDPKSNWHFEAETVTARMLRSNEAPKKYGVLPMRLFLDGDVAVRFEEDQFRARSVDVVPGIDGDLASLVAEGPIEGESVGQSVSTNARGSMRVLLPRAWLRPLARGYGYGHTGIPSSVVGLLTLEGPSESRREDDVFLANERVQWLIPTDRESVPIELIAEGAIAFRGDFVAQSQKGATVRRHGDNSSIRLGPELVDPDLLFGISGSQGGEDLRISGHGQLLADRTEFEDGSELLDARFESPRGDVTFQNRTAQLRDLGRGHVRVRGNNRLELLDLEGRPRLSGETTALKDRQLRFSAERMLSEDGLTLEFDGGRTGVTIETNEGTASGDCLHVYPLDEAVRIRLTGSPAQIDYRTPEDSQEEVFDLTTRALDFRMIGRAVPDRFARLLRIPPAMGSALRTTWIVADREVELDGNSTPTPGIDGSEERELSARSDRLITRLDSRRALLIGAPATARLVDSKGRTVEARGPRILIDVENPDEPVLRLVPTSDEAPYLDLTNEGSGPEFERLRISCEEGIALRGGRTEFGGAVTVRAIDDQGVPVPGGLDLFAPELEVDWDPTTERLRELRAHNNPILNLRGKRAEAVWMNIHGSTVTLEPSYEIELLGTDDEPVLWTDGEGSPPIAAERVLLRYPDEYVRVQRARTVSRLERSTEDPETARDR
ncbi:MAG: hypothetical protein AAF196_11095 [Planctomycetota bacterium]